MDETRQGLGWGIKIFGAIIILLIIGVAAFWVMNANKPAVSPQPSTPASQASQTPPTQTQPPVTLDTSDSSIQADMQTADQTIKDLESDISSGSQSMSDAPILQ